MVMVPCGMRIFISSWPSHRTRIDARLDWHIPPRDEYIAISTPCSRIMCLICLGLGTKSKVMALETGKVSPQRSARPRESEVRRLLAEWRVADITGKCGSTGIHNRAGLSCFVCMYA